MNKKIILCILCVIALLQACKKEDPIIKEKEKEKEEEQQEPGEQKEQIIEISTSHGTMYMWLYKETPEHRKNFLKLAGEGFYDGTTFHRIIPNFMIQGGDPNSKDDNPNNDGTGGPGYEILPEFVESLKNIRGAVATARTDNPQKKSSGSQFFINVVENKGLNNQYTVFGYIMKGIEVADKIASQPRDKKDRPNTDIKMEVKIVEKTKAEILSEYGYEGN